MGILLIELPPLSMRITSSPVPGRTPILKAFDAILTSLQIKRFVLVSHSYGTFLAAYLLRPPNDPSLECQNKATPSYGTFSTDPPTQTSTNLGPNSDLERQLHHALASKVAHAILIDPIPILLHLHSVAYNFLYRTPHSAAEWQLWYFASRDPDVARTLHRAFFWEEGCLWGDDLVRFVCGADVSVEGDDDDLGRTKGGHNLAVVLAGKDQIVPADTVRGYLTGELQPKARWLGKARCSGPSSCSTTYPWFVKTDEGGVRGRQNLEVLFYPELDHATVFDTRERRQPILDVIARFAAD
jgi:pimeloyl-ACP methyl ester carboxylesterase